MEAEPTEPKEELVPKRGNRNSIIWLWFGFKKSDTDQTTVICKTCRQQVVTSDSNTLNLFHHLKTRHEEQYRDSVKMRESTNVTSKPRSDEKKNTHQTSLKESLSKGTVYDKQSRNHRKITDAMSKFICVDMAPVYTVEKKGFRALVKTLDPRCNMPDPKHFSYVQLPRMYEECRAKVKEELQHVEYYTLTTDLRTSRVTQPYMSLTVHFINSDWVLRSRCLQTSYFPEDHTGVMIATALKEALQSWELREDMLICVTTDNATNNISALQLNEWNSLQCFGHRLQLAIGEWSTTLPMNITYTLLIYMYASKCLCNYLL